MLPFAAHAAPTVQTLLDTGSRCAFVDPSSAAPADWSALQFNTAGWSTGPIPMGHAEAVLTDIGVPKRTAYFRCAFNVSDAAMVMNAVAKLRLDDGGVVYLNGQKLASINMPGRAIGYDTPAYLDNWDGTREVSYAIAASQLRTGTNVLAVELHQNFSPTWISGDATFDVTLQATMRDAPPGWKLHFADHFDGTAVNAGNWRTYHNPYGDGDPFILHCLTPSNVSVGQGSLKLTARKQAVQCPKSGKTVAKAYTSGFLGSRDIGRYYPLFGRYEARVRVPHGQGMFPAFWLRHRNGAGAAEVDIMEIFHSSRPGNATQTLHFPQNIGYNVAQKGKWVEPAVKGRGAWHTYSVDILPVVPGDKTKVRFVMRIDGVPHYEYLYDYAKTTKTIRVKNPDGTYTTKKAPNWVTSADPMGSWDIALQLWVGGRWVGHPDQTLGWYPTSNTPDGKPGRCAQTNKTPSNGPDSCPKNGIWLTPWNDATIEFDYVKVYVPE